MARKARKVGSGPRGGTGGAAGKVPRKAPRPTRPGKGAKEPRKPRGGWGRVPRSLDLREPALFTRGGKGRLQVHNGTFAVYQAGQDDPTGWLFRSASLDKEFWVVSEGNWNYPGASWEVADWLFEYLTYFKDDDHQNITQFIVRLRSRTIQAKDTGGFLPDPLRPWEHTVVGYEEV